MSGEKHEIPVCVDPIGPATMTLDEFKAKYAESIRDPNAFWTKEAVERLSWYQPFEQALQGGFEHGDVSWFAGGKLNVSYNAIDRHCLTKPDQTAILWEGDEPDDIRRITYAEMKRKVSQISNALAAQGVKQGDVVTIYMPMSKFCLSFWAGADALCWQGKCHCSRNSHKYLFASTIDSSRTPHYHAGLRSNGSRAQCRLCWVLGGTYFLVHTASCI